MTILRAWVAFFCLLTFGESDDCSPGVQWKWGDQVVLLDYAYLDSAQFATNEYVSFQGSFIPLSTRTHSFTMTTHAYSTSAQWVALPLFTFEGIRYFPIGEVPSLETSLDLSKDFRYAFSGKPDTNYRWIQVELQESGVTVGPDCAQRCALSGCRNLDYSRQPYSCQPSPSPSLLPAPARSRTFDSSRRFLGTADLRRSSGIQLTRTCDSSRRLLGTADLRVSSGLELTRAFDSSRRFLGTADLMVSSGIELTRGFTATRSPSLPFTTSFVPFRGGHLLWKTLIFVWMADALS